MTFYVAAMDETDKFLVREPAVGQYIPELYPFTDSPLYHLLCKIDFGHVVCLFPFTEYLVVISEFLKNVLISERKGVILCIDMGLSMFFGGT